MSANAKSGSTLKAGGLIAVLLAMLLAFGMAGCSSSTSKNSRGEELINGHTVAEYNADVDNLGSILSQAKSLKYRIDGMGDPSTFTSQSQVDEYNSLVSQYNSAADRYNSAAKAFSSKYGSTIDGAGSRPADPDSIDLPRKK